MRIVNGSGVIARRAQHGKSRLAWALLFIASLLSATTASAQNTSELASLDIWIVERFRGAQLLPDSGARSSLPRSSLSGAQAGAPRVEAARRANMRDTVVALHFGTAPWRAALGSATPVQFADPTGAISSISGRVTARRAFRTPRVPGARDTVKGDWRVGWAYLVAIPSRAANAASSGLNGWALVEAPKASARSANAKNATTSGAATSGAATSGAATSGASTSAAASAVESPPSAARALPETTATVPPRGN